MAGVVGCDSIVSKKYLEFFFNLCEAGQGSDFKPSLPRKCFQKCAVSVNTVALCGRKTERTNI